MKDANDFEAIKQKAYMEARRKLSAKHETQLCEDIAQDVAMVLCTREKADIRSPLAFAGTLAQRMADTYLRKKSTHSRFLQRAAIPSESDSTKDPSAELFSLEQREQLRSTLLNLDVLDALHLLAVSLNLPANEVLSALYENADAQPSVATVYSHRNRAIERARKRLAI